MTERATNEDILAAMDELFEALGTTNAAIASLHKKLDRQREVALETLKHCERLVKKDEDMMRSMGIYGLVRRANEEQEIDLTNAPDVIVTGPTCAHPGCKHLANATIAGEHFCHEHVWDGLSTPGRAAQDTLHDLGERIKKL